MVCDNYATHKHPAVKAWLERNPRITAALHPDLRVLVNLVELCFGIITRQAIRRGTFGSRPRARRRRSAATPRSSPPNAENAPASAANANNAGADHASA